METDPKTLLCPVKAHRRGAAQYLPELSIWLNTRPTESVGIFPLVSELWDGSSMTCQP